MFYFIRHGEPDYSHFGKTIYNGIGNNFIPLTDNGIKQIKKAANDNRLSDADVIISSPYTRAIQSAAILSKELRIDLIVEANLFEWYGNKNYNADHIESSDLLKEFISSNGDYPEGVEMQWEDNRIMRERVFNTLDKYIDYKKVIVVCHNILIRSLKPWNQSRFLECGEIVEFEYDKKDYGSANGQEKDIVLADYTPEQIEAAKNAKSPGELIAMAKSIGIELTQKQAENALKQLRESPVDIEIYENLKHRTWEILKKSNNHGAILHLDGVAMLCAFIGLKRGLDVEACKCAGLLHDLWMYRHGFPLEGDLHGRHGYLGSELAREILIENGGYSDEQIEVICRMVYNHNDKNDVHDEHSEALKDADALQHYLNGSNYDKRYNYYERDKKIFDEFVIKREQS